MQKEKNILVFTTWSYKDGLIQAATLPYLKIISKIIDGTIYLICWEQADLKLTKEEASLAEQELLKHRIKLIRFNYHKNKLWAGVNWGFGMAYLIIFAYLKRISYLHPFCAPAATMIWIISKFKKTKIVADSFEPHAELMAEMGIWNRNSMLFKLIFFLEKKIVIRADYLIAVSKNISTYIKKHYRLNISVDKIFYRPLCVNADLFIKSNPDYSLIGWDKKENKIIGVYTGKIGGMYYEEEFCTFIKKCIQFWKEDFHLIMCTSMDKLYLERFFESHGIEEKYFTIAFVEHTKIPLYLSLADFGMSFSRPSDARQYGCPTKNAEYWSIGMPIITTDATLDDTNNIYQRPYLGVIINNEESHNIDATLTALDALICHKDEKLIRSFAIRERSFEKAKNVYEQIYS